MPNSLIQVTFHDAQVVCVMHDGKPFVALRPLCDALEIAWEAQFRAIKKDPVLTSVVDELSTTGADGKRYSMLCLPLDYLNGWLFKIDAGRYKPGDPRRDRIIAYQRECYRVLAEYFLGGGRARLSAVRAAWGYAKYDLRWFFEHRNIISREAAEQLFRDAFGGTMPSTLAFEYNASVWEQGGNPAPALAGELSEARALSPMKSPAPYLLGGTDWQGNTRPLTPIPH